MFGVEARYRICGAELQTGVKFAFSCIRRCTFDAWAPAGCHHLKSAAHYLWWALKPWQRALVQQELQSRAEASLQRAPYDFWKLFAAAVTVDRRCWVRVHSNPVMCYEDDPHYDLPGGHTRTQLAMEAGMVTAVGRRGGVDHRLPREPGMACRFASVFD